MPETAVIEKAGSWHAVDAGILVAGLGSDAAAGLSEAEARRRLAADGPNALPEPAPVSRWVLFLSQFKSLVIWLLIGAGLVSGLMGEVVDAVAILTIVVLNGLIGYFQEDQAERSISALRKLTAPSAKVLRDGGVRNVPSAGLVRGDVLELESGDLVPADARLIDASDLRCLEAALTGESEPVPKNPATLSDAHAALGDRFNMVYMGTSVSYGAGRALVVATAAQTEIGKIAGLIHSAQPDASTPLQKRMDSLSRTLVWICLGLVLILFILGLLREWDPFGQFLTAVSLAVAAAPEGMPAVVTVSLALGVQRMAKRNALVRRLPSVETMGSVTVICTDKTGTLTAGEMTVKELYCDGEPFTVDGAGLEPVGKIHRQGRPPSAPELERLRQLAAIQAGTATASLYQEDGRWKVAGDPTEGALIAVGRKLGLAAGAAPERVHAFPFDSERKRAGALEAWEHGSQRLLVNGAPDMLLALCTQAHGPDGPQALDEAGRARILAANAAMAARGLRVIGSAYRICAPQPEGTLSAQGMERDLVFAGLAGMQDPPRPEAETAVAKCKAAGIQVVMITGDHPVTALAIAAELGIATAGGDALTGARLDAMDQAALESAVAGASVFARVSAAHKLRIVQAWRARGAIVAMTGDGVNDAPALKGAHIGIAMGRGGTEVTKQASDMIITDDDFASIVAAVEEGRGIFQNIRNTLQFLLAGNSGELLLMAAGVAAGLSAPLLPIHLLWINLVTDGLPALCLAAERIDPDVMKRKPGSQTAFLSDPTFYGPLLLTGMLTGGVSLAAYLIGMHAGGLATARSFAFSTLVLAELLRSFGARSESKPLWKLDPRGNPRLFAVVGVSLLAQLFLHRSAWAETVFKITPLTWAQDGTVLALGCVPLLALEIVKAARGWFSPRGNRVARTAWTRRRSASGDTRPR